ncbi:MAG: entericidin [Micavibrio aeruginosavorus]|uniref:Entericidin n=1 Tax=Micavibrio aeruginosavorus TaxID=349221 RepID=A0A2W5MWP0_9BACT|nr:MAG: entericidin [Micavibrio aeruginosavorus]
MKKTFALAIVALLTVGSLAACSNTFHGAGEDIENAGESVQEAVPPKN